VVVSNLLPPNIRLTSSMRSLDLLELSLLLLEDLPLLDLLPELLDPECLFSICDMFGEDLLELALLELECFDDDECLDDPDPDLSR